MALSEPTQFKSSSQIGPEPGAACITELSLSKNPSWWQTTTAASSPKASSQTVPHTPARRISRRPWSPSVRRISLSTSVPASKQDIPTSSWCRQLCEPHPACPHSTRAFSIPLHRMSSNQICPSPGSAGYHMPSVKPSCRQTTRAFVTLKPSSQTVPHSPAMEIWRRPWSPSVRRMLMGPESKHNTPTSSWCLQSWEPHPEWPHSERALSLPVHSKSSNQICPVP
mmetsp:Transcript_4067/g.8209  ORF Transcript_4067/g.8209 Transcript_4067/m.8209 type:complete len:225 (+) Transcript_4067:713-1387(+)